ncbi:hypothetical protein SRHO_G00317840 [Serrasalmus rhombeus]
MLLDHSFLRSEWRAAHCPLKPPGEREAEEKTHALIRTHGAPAYSESFIHLRMLTSINNSCSTQLSSRALPVSQGWRAMFQRGSGSSHNNTHLSPVMTETSTKTRGIRMAVPPSAGIRGGEVFGVVWVAKCTWLATVA